MLLDSKYRQNQLYRIETCQKKTERKAILYEKYYLHLLTIQLSIVDNVIDFNMLHLTGNT